MRESTSKAINKASIRWTRGSQCWEGETMNFRKSMENKQEVRCFDLDGTIIKTKSGKKYPVDIGDWEFRNNTVVEKIKKISRSS